MRVVCAIVAAGLSLMAAMGSTLAQGYSQPDYRYEGRDYDYRGGGSRYDEPNYRYRDQGPRYEDRDPDYRDRGPRSHDRAVVFSEAEYLRCNRDVLRAVRNGGLRSGWVHYQKHGRYEGRRLRC